MKSLVVVLALLLAACSSGPRAIRVAPPRYPNVVGTVIALQPNNNGELLVHRQNDVTLLMKDGRHILVPVSAAAPGWTGGIMCRTRDLNRADGTYASPCQLQAFVSHGQAVWIDVIGTLVGTVVAVSDKWFVLADGTAIPVPKAPQYPYINCRPISVQRNANVDSFTHTGLNRPVRVSVNDDGTLARVDCPTSGNLSGR